MIFEFIERLRKKPLLMRQQTAAFAAVIVMAAITIVWLAFFIWKILPAGSILPTFLSEQEPKILSPYADTDASF